jgi:electron transfer flavoprotein alpha subunit
MSSIRVDTGVCVGCGECVGCCPYGCIKLENDVALIDLDTCVLCGSCVEACLVGAISREEAEEVRVAPKASGVWVCAEVAASGTLHPSALELLSPARDLGACLGEEVAVVVVAHEASGITPTLAAHGATKVYVIADPTLDLVDEEATARLIADLARQHRPSIMLMGATPFGRSVAPRIAAKLGTGLTADCTGLSIDSDTRLLIQTRPAFGGNLMARIICPFHRPQMATVRPGVFRAAPVRPVPAVEVVCSPADVGFGPSRARVLSSRKLPEVCETIEGAEIIVAGGLGMGSREGFKLAQQLADVLGGAVGASRAVVDEGWVPAACQVGQTGRTVSPQVYVALGISGAVQHCVGMQSAGLVIAVNKDPHAAIFQVADLGIVAPMEEAVPRLVEMIEKERILLRG